MPAPDIVAVVGQHCAAQPNATAVRTETESMTYGALGDAADAVAGWLRASGAGIDDVVAVQLARTPRLVAGLLGVLRAGAAWMPVDTQLPPRRRDELLDQARCRWMIVDPGVPVEGLPAGCAAVPVDEMLASGKAACEVVPDLALAYVIFTSGSSGRPKGVMVPRRSLASLVSAMNEMFGEQLGSTVAVTTSCSFDVSVFELFGTLASGGEVLLLDSILDVSGLPDQFQPRLLSGVPSALRELVALADLPDSIELVVSAGEALPNSTADAVLGTGVRLFNAYGPTEVTVYATGAEITNPADITIGVAIPGVGAVVLDDDHAEVPPGMEGRLFLRGSQVARGYLRRPATTAERFLPDPWGPPGSVMYDSGDIVSRGKDERLSYRGRSDNQVKIRGFRIELEEVDDVMGRHPAVVACLSFVDSRARSARLVAALTLSAPATEGELLAHAGEHLPPYMVPSRLVLVGSLPRSATGKLDRVAAARSLLSQPTQRE